MKNSCNAVFLILFLALFANAQEFPIPLPSDSSLAKIPPDSSLAVDSLLATKASESASEPAKVEKNVAEGKIPKIRDTSNPEDYQKNLRMAAYLHPLPFIFGAAYDMFMFSATFEVPLSLNNSFIVQPTVWLGSSDGYIPDMAKYIYIFKEGEVEYENLKRAGAGIGLRHYIAQKAQGFYLQVLANAYYVSVESISYKDNNNYDDDYYWDKKITTWKKAKGAVGEFMFYIGSAHKWQSVSLFYEGGVGYGYDGTKTHQIGYSNKLVTTFNLGIGVPLF